LTLKAGMAELDHIILEYIEESNQLLPSAESGLLQMESKEMGDEAVHAVFRAIHAIRGGAAMAGLVKIEQLSRQMENLLDLCRNRDIEPAQPVTDSLLQSLDVLASLCGRVAEHESIDIESSASALEAALSSGLEPAIKDDIRTVSPGALPGGLPHFQISRYRLKHKLRQGNLYFIHLGQHQIVERGLTPIQLLNELISMGEVLDVITSTHSGDMAGPKEAAVSFDILYESTLELDLLKTALRLGQEDLRLLNPDDFSLSQAPVSDGETESAPRETPAPEAGNMNASQPEKEPAEPPVQKLPRPAPSQDRTAFSNLEAPLESGDDSEGLEFLTFTLGVENYGVDILSVQEIIALPRLTKVPRAPRHVLGVMNLRGMVVPVMDMRLRLSLPRDDEIEPVVVVMQAGGKLLGAAVDSVSDVLVFKETEIQEPPDFPVAVHREYMRGLCRQGDDLIVLLELDQLLAPEA
jgi:chemotaxis signal transduction protein/HPt (histidine-containing phosphotransfer) domain-containing protein